MIVKLTVRGGNNDGAVIMINRDTFVIGRSPECNLKVNSAAISRQHAVITIDNDIVKVRDLGSTNGTFLNGERISKEEEIHDGCLLQFGPLQTVVRFALSHPQAAVETNSGKTDSTQKEPSKSGNDEIDLSALFEEDSARKAAEFQKTMTNIMDWKKMAEEENIPAEEVPVQPPVKQPNSPDSRDAASKALEAMFRHSVQKK